MIASVERVEDALRISRRQVWLLIIALLVGVGAASGLAARLGLLPVALALVGVAAATLASLRWPLLPLLIFAVLIPIEEVLVVEGIGTLSRFAGLLFAATYGIPRLGRLFLGVMPTAAWAYCAWALVSLGWAINPDVGWAQLTTLIQLFAIALLIGDLVVARPSIVRPILWVYSLSATVTAGLGTVAFLTSGTRSVAIHSQDPAQFAAVLLPAVVFGTYEVLEGPRRIPGALIALVSTIGVLVSGTRGAWVSLAVVVALIIIPQLSARRRIVTVLFAALLLAVALQLPGVADLVYERSETAVSTGGAGRTDIWTVAGTIYLGSPILGVGYANLPIAYTADAIRRAGVEGYLLPGASAHNLVIGTLVELGPLGLVLLGLFVVPLCLRRGWGPNAAIVQASLVSLLTASLFVDLFVNRKQVWLIIGLAIGLAHLARRMHAGDSSGPPAASPQRGRGPSAP